MSTELPSTFGCRIARPWGSGGLLVLEDELVASLSCRSPCDRAGTPCGAAGGSGGSWSSEQCSRFSGGRASARDTDLCVWAGGRARIDDLRTATGVVHVAVVGGHVAARWVLSWVMSSRLAARAAARSWSRSSSWSRRSMACCSSVPICCLSWSMSSGAPRPDSCHACSPSDWDRRCSSWWTRAARRTERWWAVSRSACSDARLTAGPTPGALGFGFGGVDLFEQVAVAVEEGAVHSGASGDAADADLVALVVGVVEGFEDALAAAGGVGASSLGHGSAAGVGDGHASLFSAHVGCGPADAGHAEHDRRGAGARRRRPCRCGLVRRGEVVEAAC